jgi:hypothetical protein
MGTEFESQFETGGELIRKQVGRKVHGSPVEQVYQLYEFLRKISGPRWTAEKDDEPIRKTVGRSRQG